MTRRAWDLDQGSFRGFYRDPENGWLFGVCAGIADRYNLHILMVRVVFVVFLLVFTWLTALTYIAAVLLIREKPLVYSGRDNEDEFWRRNRNHWRHS